MSSEVIKRHSWFIRLGAPYKGHRDHRKLELLGEEHVVPRPFDR